MKSFWIVVNRVIAISDVIIEVLDARFPEETRNLELEKKVAAKNKQLLLLLNKADLLPKEELEEKKFAIKEHPVIYLSSKDRNGISRLREQLMIMFKRTGKENIFVGIVGYPNTGKSSVINALRGKGSASTASYAGHTKGKQYIRISKDIMLVDTPGVLPYSEKDEKKHALIASINPQKVKDPESVAEGIIDLFKEYDINRFKDFYKVEFDEKNSSDEILEKIALGKKKVKRGNIADTQLMGRIILQDWQRGKLKL